MVPTSSEAIRCHHLPSTKAKVCSSRSNHRATRSGSDTVAALAAQQGWLSSQVTLLRTLGSLGRGTHSRAGKRVARRGKGLACREAGKDWPAGRQE